MDTLDYSTMSIIQYIEDRKQQLYLQCDYLRMLRGLGNRCKYCEYNALSPDFTTCTMLERAKVHYWIR